MNKCFKPAFFAATLAVFSIANAQDVAIPAAPEAVAATPVPVAEPVAEAPVAEPVPEPVVQAPVAVPVPEPVVEAAVAPAPAPDSSTITLIVEEAKPVKKKRNVHSKASFAVVDVPANFEIQAKKVMPVDSDEWGSDNLDQWWGRANLMVLTESENFVGKVHLRMYPGEFQTSNPETKSDLFQLYEAWAWHRGDYFNVKIGRWDNTTRFGSVTYGGYVDAKKDKNYTGFKNDRNRRASGFLSTYGPENALQFGFNNFSENVSLDIALISNDPNLNNGDLRVYFGFKDLAGLENMNIGIGYRSNVFDEIYSKYGDVTHTVDLGIRMPIVKDAGILKSFSVFAEAALIGIDDNPGDDKRADNGKISNEYNPIMPVLGGLDFAFYRGLDRIVIEAEYDGDRPMKKVKKDVKDVLGSIYALKKLNDRFTLHLGVQSENNTRDFSFAGRLQGRIN